MLKWGDLCICGAMWNFKARNTKSRLSNHTASALTLCDFLHMRFLFLWPLVVLPPRKQSIARNAAFQPPTTSSAKMGSLSKKWAFMPHLLVSQ